MSALMDMARLDIDEGFREILDYGQVVEATDCDAAAFERVVESRRSVRGGYEPSVAVPAEIMNRCIDLAMMAPNSSNLQPWEFYWVRSPEKKEKLVEFCMSQPTARTASELIVVVGRVDTWKRNNAMMLQGLRANPSAPKGAIDYHRLVTPMIYMMGIFNLFAVMKFFMFNMMGWFKPLPREPNFRSGMKMWATKSACLAAAQLMLAFRAHGYDSCPMEGCDQKRVRKLLGLPGHAQIPMVVSVGKRAKNGVYGPRVRLDRKLFVKEV